MKDGGTCSDPAARRATCQFREYPGAQRKRTPGGMKTLSTNHMAGFGLAFGETPDALSRPEESSGHSKPTNHPRRKIGKGIIII